MTQFWLQDIKVLIQKDQLHFWTDTNMTLNENLNAITRTVLILSIAGFIVTMTMRFIWIGIITSLLIVCYHQYKNVESFQILKGKPKFTFPTSENPLMNVMIPEIMHDPTRPKAEPYTEKTDEKILECVKDILPDKKIYKGVNNEMALEYSMRAFHTTASTTIPNDQAGYGEFCYGNMISRKEGNEEALSKHAPRIGSVG
jgi:hypothetical protein